MSNKHIKQEAVEAAENSQIAENTTSIDKDMAATTDFDAKGLAFSLRKLMAMADTCITKPGAGAVTIRMMDYCTEELSKLSSEQSLQVLAEIDDNYQKSLLKDGNGNIIGYMYSKRIFISMKKDAQDGNNFADHNA